MNKLLLISATDASFPSSSSVGEKLMRVQLVLLVAVMIGVLLLSPSNTALESRTTSSKQIKLDKALKYLLFQVIGQKDERKETEIEYGVGSLSFE